MKKIIRNILILVMTLTLGACSSGSKANKTASNTLNFGIFNTIETLEPTTNWDSWYLVRMGVGETLVKFSESMEKEPWLAKSWKLGNDKKTWTFKINDKATFSNGKKVTGKAVADSIKRVFKLNPERAKTEFFEYESISAKGQTVTIKTKVAAPNLPGFLADPLFMIVDTSGDTSKYADEGPIATGPYKVSNKTNEQITTVRNDNYWDGKGALDGANFVLIADTNTRSMAMESGEIDMAAYVSHTDLQAFKESKDFNVDEIQSLRLVMAYMNNTSTLKDENLRKAIISALDLKTYAKQNLNDVFTPAVGPLPTILNYSEGLKDPYSFDEKKAKSILEKAGYKDTDNDGYIEKNGQPITLKYIYYSSRAELPVLAQATESALKKIGIKVELQSVDYGTLTKVMQSMDYDLLSINVLTAGTGDPESFLRGTFRTNAASNAGKYSNKKVDKLLDKLQVEFNEKKRKSLINEIQQELINAPGTIFYAYPNTNIIYRNNIENVKMYAADYYWVTKDVAFKQEAK